MLPTRSTRQERILIVAKDDELRTSLADTLESVGGYTVNKSRSFEQALSEILLTEFDLIVTEAELPDLSGMDLLAVVGGLRPNARVIVIDDDLSAKSAVAVYRLGAVDYLYKPLNMTFVVMQIERHLESKRIQDAAAAEQSPDQPPPPRPKPPEVDERAKRLDPTTRPAALVLGRNQFKRINWELSRLLGHVKANFVGLVDSEGNMIGAAGTLEDFDLSLLTHALNIDHTAQLSLASILEESKFHSTYFEGDSNGVYIIEFSHPYTVSLAVICGTDVKPGMVWLYTKRTASTIEEILKTMPAPKNMPQM